MERKKSKFRALALRAKNMVNYGNSGLEMVKK